MSESNDPKAELPIINVNSPRALAAEVEKKKKASSSQYWWMAFAAIVVGRLLLRATLNNGTADHPYTSPQPAISAAEQERFDQLMKSMKDRVNAGTATSGEAILLGVPQEKYEQHQADIRKRGLLPAENSSKENPSSPNTDSEPSEESAR